MAAVNQICFMFLSDAQETMRELLTEITKKEHMPTQKRMGYLNNFAQVSLSFI